MYQLIFFSLLIVGLPFSASAESCSAIKSDGTTTLTNRATAKAKGWRIKSCYGPGVASKRPTTRKSRRTVRKKTNLSERDDDRTKWSPVKRPSKLQKLRKARPTTSKAARERAQRYETFVRNAAEVYSLPEALIWAVMHTESHFDPTVVSNKGAHGLMQLLPETAKSMGVRDIFDPEENIMGGARYLRVLANRFEGDLYKVIAGYNAGPGAVAAANGIPFKQTGEYVRRVMNAYYTFEAQSPTKAP